MKSFFLFLKTKIGLALVAFVLIVAGALVLRYHPIHIAARSQNDTGLAVGATTTTPVEVQNFEDTAAFLDSAPDSQTPTAPKATSSISFNATDRFAQELFMKYIEAKRTGQDLSPEIDDQIASLVLNNDYTTDVAATISSRDLKIVASTPNSLKGYGNSVAQAISTPLPYGQQDELALLEDYVNGTGKVNPEQFLPLLERYRSINKILMDMQVPDKAVISHVKAVNSINIIIRAVQGMTEINSDPVAVITKTGAYIDGLNLFEASMLGMQSVFVANKVNFAAQDPGYLFAY